MNPTDEWVQDALVDAGADYGPHLLPPRTIPNDSTTQILLLAPIPVYLVYDGFENDLDAAMVYERLLTTAQTGPMIDHARQFLCSALVGPFRANDKKPFVPAAEWLTMPPPPTRIWRKQRVETLFPSVFPTLNHHTNPKHRLPS